MTAQVSPEQKRRRYEEARRLALRMKQELLCAAVGRREEVLWESQSGQGSDATLWGYTRNYLRASIPVSQGTLHGIDRIEALKVEQGKWLECKAAENPK